MVARPLGYTDAQTPYFFLQEFKRRKGAKLDPEGQMLAAMLIARAKNPGEQPIYGCWVQGNTWTFTILQDNTYFFSKDFDTMDAANLQQIVFVLRHLKKIILERNEPTT